MIIDDKGLNLKPCPFCGAHPTLNKDDGASWLIPTRISDDDPAYSVECDNVDCDCNPCTILFKTKEEAIEAWNKRVKETDE